MELGFDAKRLFCNFTGLGNYSRSLISNLHKYYPSFTCHLFTPRIVSNDTTRWYSESGEFPVHLPRKPLLRNHWRSFSIKKDLAKQQIKIYHGLSHEIPFGIPSTGIKTVVTIHDLIFKHYPNTYPMVDRWMYDLKFRYACRNADKIIAISESTKADIIRFYDIPPDKIHVIYQPCGRAYYSLQSDSDCEKILQEYNIGQEYILSVGSIEERKNLKTLLRAYALLPSDLRIPLVIVGRGKKYRDECRQLARELGIMNNLLWLDFLGSMEHLQALYQKAAVMVYPSLYEGFGLPVAEALLSKTPVITSNVSSMPEAAGPSSICINPLDAEEMAQALERVLTNNTLREKMINDGYQHAINNFSPETTTRQVAELYLSMI